MCLDGDHLMLVVLLLLLLLLTHNRALLAGGGVNAPRRTQRVTPTSGVFCVVMLQEAQGPVVLPVNQQEMGGGLCCRHSHGCLPRKALVGCWNCAALSSGARHHSDGLHRVSGTPAVTFIILQTHYAAVRLSIGLLWCQGVPRVSVTLTRVSIAQSERQLAALVWAQLLLC
jgi:hypothetical protein